MLFVAAFFAFNTHSRTFARRKYKYCLNLIHNTQLKIHADSEENLPSASDILTHIEPFTKGYIWHRHTFWIRSSTEALPPWRSLRRRNRQDDGGTGKSCLRENQGEEDLDEHQAFLWGQTQYGDNVEDEWFVTWLLMEVARKFRSTAVRLWDSDGEFLLIEAAYSLPRWLKPEVATNRVWLHQGHVHLVAKQVSEERTATSERTKAKRGHQGRRYMSPLSISTALNVIKSTPNDSLSAGECIDGSIAAKLHDYPQKAMDSMHQTRALVPVRIAHMLQRNPQIVSACVDAFFNRDPYDIALVSNGPVQFPPEEGMALVGVKFSRCLYAQIALQDFHPPRRWPSPPSKEKDPEGYAAASLGAKLAAGFEMILANASRERMAHSCARRDSKRTIHLEGDTGQHTGPDLAPESYLPVIQALMKEPVVMEDFKASDLPPCDEESWLYEAPGIMDAEVRRRELEVEQYEARKAEDRSKKRYVHNGDEREADGAVLSQGIEDANEEHRAVFDPLVFSQKFKSFLEGSSGLEGTEVETDGMHTGLNEERFLEELRAVLEMDWGNDRMQSFLEAQDSTGNRDPATMGGVTSQQWQAGTADISELGSSSEDDAEGSSFYTGSRSGNSSESDEEDTILARPNEVAKNDRVYIDGFDPWDADTETDSDDDSEEEEGMNQVQDEPEDDFMSVYTSLLERQLKGTTLECSFVKKSRCVLNEASSNAISACSEGNRRDALHGVVVDNVRSKMYPPGHISDDDGPDLLDPEDSRNLQPVDVDVNLVDSLLSSYREQLGLPGPVSNLAGMMGISLPDSNDLELEDEKTR